eukprot:SAG22_NODE_714_length_7722_cov_3.919585_8_plen_75_part_00
MAGPPAVIYTPRRPPAAGIGGQTPVRAEFQDSTPLPFGRCTPAAGDRADSADECELTIEDLMLQSGESLGYLGD